jgi:hypothetical protein
MKLKWFGPGKRGGVGPRTWEGWLATALMVVMVAASLYWLRPLVAQWTGVHPRLAGVVMLPAWIVIYGAVVFFTYDREA